MKLGLVGDTRGDVARLESVLVLLLEERGVRQVFVAGPAAAGDLAAVLRSRERRFPREVGWSEPGFADFVLGAVVDGVGAAPSPAEELSRNERLTAQARAAARGRPAVEVLGGRRIIAFGPDEAAVPADAALVVRGGAPPGLERPAGPGRPALLRPGSLAADAALVCAEVDLAPEGLLVRFLDGRGTVVRTEPV